jgi:hypothetical protein
VIEVQSTVEQWHSKESLARMLRVSERQIDYYREQGLRCVKLGAGKRAPVRFRPVDVDEFLAGFGEGG